MSVFYTHNYSMKKFLFSVSFINMLVGMSLPNMTITSETFRDWTPAGTGNSRCVDEPAQVASTSAVQLCFSADPDCRPQPAETHPPSAVLAQAPQPAIHGCQPALFPATWSVHHFEHVLLLP